MRGVVLTHRIAMSYLAAAAAVLILIATMIYSAYRAMNVYKPRIGGSAPAVPDSAPDRAMPILISALSAAGSDCVVPNNLTSKRK